MNVARVNCDSEFGKPVCQRFEVSRTPTLLYFPVGEKVYYQYHGERTIEAFETWVNTDQWKTTEAKEVATNETIDAAWEAKWMVLPWSFYIKIKEHFTTTLL